MEWYKNLYVGPNAESKKFKLLRHINKRFLTNAYVVTIATNENDLLDIYSYNELLQNHYKNIDIQILGLACGKQEAMELTQNIIKDVYMATGGFCVRDYFAKREDSRK